MGGGGGGFFGTLLNVVSIAVPVLRPVAMVYNTINAVQSGNPLALASSALGWSNYMGGLESAAGSVDSSGWSSNDFSGGLSDSFTPSYDFYSAPTTDVAAGLDYASPFETGFDIAQANLPYTATPEEFFSGTTGFKDLQSQIASDPSAAAQGALDYSKATGIAAGSQDIAMNTLQDLYPASRFDISALTPNLDINTLGGYGAANQLLGEGGAMSLENMQGFGSAGTGMEYLSQSGGPTAALGSNQVGAFTSPTTSAFGEGYDMGPYSPEMTSMPEAPKIPNVDLTQNQDLGYSVSSNEPIYTDDWGGGTNQVGDFTNAQGNRAWQDVGSETMRDMGFGREAGGKTMSTLSDMFRGRGIQAGAKPMGPWEMGLTGAAGLYQDINQRNMMKDMRGMYDRAMAGSDQFAAERGIASQKWQQGAQNPSVAYDEYIKGGGGLAMQQAAAKAAKAGRRNILPQLESQMRMQAMSEFYPQYMKMYDPTRFAGNQAQVAGAFAGPMANLQAQRGMGTFGALGNIFKRQGW